MFESFANLASGEQLFGVDLVGEDGQLSLRAGFTKRLFKYPHPYVIPGLAHWTPVPVPNAGPGEMAGGGTARHFRASPGAKSQLAHCARSAGSYRRRSGAAW